MGQNLSNKNMGVVSRASIPTTKYEDLTNNEVDESDWIYELKTFSQRNVDCKLLFSGHFWGKIIERNGLDLRVSTDHLVHPLNFLISTSEAIHSFGSILWSHTNIGKSIQKQPVVVSAEKTILQSLKNTCFIMFHFMKWRVNGPQNQTCQPT